MIVNEELSAQLPEQPPVGSVLIGGRSGRMHQRVEDNETGRSRWYPAVGFMGRTWLEMLAAEGSVTVIWRPEVTGATRTNDHVG